MDLLPRVVSSFEGFCAKPYYDAAGKLTVGWGHLVKPTEHFTVITREQAVALLNDDLAYAAGSVDALFSGCLLTDYERDALTSFCYNMGRGNLRDSTLRQRCFQQKKREAAAEFLRWVYAEDRDTGDKRVLPGLVRRRHCESVWFLGAAPATVAWAAGIKVEE